LDVLKVWNNKLKRGGTIRISVPDFNSIVLYYEKNRDLNSVIGLLYGGQRNEYDYHKVVFNFDTLSNLLEMAGFSNVRKYDWRETEHSDVDDYSQAYLPHLEKEIGLLMSLNVEATKK
jgi:predicted SAM-dependent methyltransferase